MSQAALRMLLLLLQHFPLTDAGTVMVMPSMLASGADSSLIFFLLDVQGSSRVGNGGFGEQEIGQVFCSSPFLVATYGASLSLCPKPSHPLIPSLAPSQKIRYYLLGKFTLSLHTGLGKSAVNHYRWKTQDQSRTTSLHSGSLIFGHLGAF